MNKLMTVKQLRELLSTFPDDATVVPYEGERTGVRIDVDKKPFGFVETEGELRVERYE